MYGDVLQDAENPLNNMMDRAELRDALEIITSHHRRNERSFGLILFSVDRFKLINSRFGHSRADTVLHQIASRARELLQKRGIVGRWGGDEFLCILSGIDMATCYRIAEELRRLIECQVIAVGKSLLNVTSTFGVACYPDNGTDVQSLLVAVDEANLVAKNGGRNRIMPAMVTGNTLFSVGDMLETALREDRVMPAYQPIFDLQTGCQVGEEALARIVTIDERAIAAHEFIDVASQFQLTHKIDRTIVLTAMRYSAMCQTKGKEHSLFVNISGDLLRHPDIVRELLEAAQKLLSMKNNSNGAAKQLVIEVTEREWLDNPAAARQLLAPFLDLGIHLALDDFGSGYSSFQYLADLPISYLKIDGRLIQRLGESRVRAIVRGIQNIARELGLITLAEYVENATQAEILREIGVDWVQGHYYGGAKLDENEAGRRRQLSVNWAQGYYYRKSLPAS
ncbi:MAG: EAL domain-containing protein [Acidiferrobacterales bacterium]